MTKPFRILIASVAGRGEKASLGSPGRLAAAADGRRQIADHGQYLEGFDLFNHDRSRTQKTSLASADFVKLFLKFI